MFWWGRISMQFYGREREIELIFKLTKKKTASLVVLRGRRRIGKSSLAEYVGQSFNFLEFAGLPPEENITPTRWRIQAYSTFDTCLAPML